nr:MAG TPA: hypothetical protein [Caudoviricetes sp.]
MVSRFVTTLFDKTMVLKFLSFGNTITPVPQTYWGI